MTLQSPTTEPVPITDEGYRVYRRQLAPTTGRQHDAFAALESLVDDDHLVVDNDTLRDRIATVTDGWSRLRTVAADLHRTGAVSRVQVCNRNRRVKAIHPAVVRHVGPGCPEATPARGDPADSRRRARHVRRYLGARHRREDLTELDSAAASEAAREAWLYTTLREHTDTVGGAAPRVAVSFRELGKLDADAGRAFPFKDYLFEVSDAFGQWGVLATIHYDGLQMTRPTGLEDALRQALLNYHVATLHGHGAVGADGGPRAHLGSAWTEPDAEVGNVTARTPFLTMDVTVDTEQRVIRLASLYQRRTRT